MFDFMFQFCIFILEIRFCVILRLHLSVNSKCLVNWSCQKVDCGECIIVHTVVIAFINDAKHFPTVRHNLSLKMCKLEFTQRRTLRTITDSSL